VHITRAKPSNGPYHDQAGPPYDGGMTGPTDASVDGFLDAVPDERRRGDARRLLALMSEVTRAPPVMWGSGIVGFGRYRYRYDSGREGESLLAGFAPRKQHLVVYLVGGFEDQFGSVLDRLGPHKTGKGCLYLKGLDGVDIDVLRELVERSVRALRDIDTSPS
jgi:hypothetical protein